jgi:hypothetical protein
MSIIPAQIVVSIHRRGKLIAQRSVPWQGSEYPFKGVSDALCEVKRISDETHTPRVSILQRLKNFFGFKESDEKLSP